MFEFDNEEYSVKDVVQAVVTSCCSKGVFLDLSNGQKAFAYFGGLVPGTEVLCTVLKKSTEKWRTLVAIDSVLGKELVA